MCDRVRIVSRMQWKAVSANAMQMVVVEVDDKVEQATELERKHSSQRRTFQPP